MENFTMMLGYDPKVAKEDNTNVFQEVCVLYIYITFINSPDTIFNFYIIIV